MLLLTYATMSFAQFAACLKSQEKFEFSHTGRNTATSLSREIASTTLPEVSDP